MISPRHANFLRKTPSKDLLDDYSKFTSERFSREGLPVLIAARNEQEDLPATLISLANSNIELNPIVIENGSNDETASRARKLGAEVLHGDVPFKLAALQTGVQMLHAENRLEAPVLFTDADTLVGKNWAYAMSHAATSPDNKTSRVVAGSAIYWNGPSAIVDTLRTANALTKDTLSAFRQQSPIGRGHNMAINFADDESIAAYTELDPRLFIAEEQAIMDAIVARKGVVVRSLGLHSLVLTRGDRYSNIKDCFAVKNDPNFDGRKRLYEEYGDFIPYTTK